MGINSIAILLCSLPHSQNYFILYLLLPNLPHPSLCPHLQLMASHHPSLRRQIYSNGNFLISPPDLQSSGYTTSSSVLSHGETVPPQVKDQSLYLCFRLLPPTQGLHSFSHSHLSCITSFSSFRLFPSVHACALSSTILRVPLEFHKLFLLCIVLCFFHSKTSQDMHYTLISPLHLPFTLQPTAVQFCTAP